MDWVDELARLRGRGEAGVLLTVATVRGHAPREPGAKLVVSRDATWGTIGGGNAEASAIDRARELLDDGAAGTELLTFRLNDRVATEHGVQCCGGEMTVLVEPIRPRRVVAVFGLGHVGFEIAHVLARHELRLVLVDSRAEATLPERFAALATGPADLSIRHEAAPERVVADLPAEATLLVLTHDHAEDFVLCDAALRHASSGYIGLIGSNAKWQRFRSRLADEGHTAEAIDRITCPIGIPDITAKDPASIAVAVAADLLARRDAGVPR
ncbi:xanthine dehydrogenase accessory protein XdhC [Pseudoclavibacter chungangensis]|uniref:Xanthine dehydrogenase accessory protein XdhC n=1 Tax=Pseudoclavibacter chungangensis TaxID=587635 RepID=A0A7J5BMY0_9MICO|nr:xanthine dehydrogenase accessory protein XdhC [Pseudoclavibacter chungangensis]KAB1652310.1 xanthine dehydrogenase accessory protein XdhC [Pseudoclavibacter chungangensis]NYJ66904.1 xanthine dehydrogenase accessory factor [Pseudoclavibacter chungangensis]